LGKIDAQEVALSHLSTHTDAREIMDWLKPFKTPLLGTIITHREPEPSDTLCHRMGEELGGTGKIPEYLERVILK
jgi:hypothetical protein